MTLGQEFGAFAVTLGEDEQRLAEARLLLHELNLGGTAIGTALNAHPEYRDRAVAELRRLTGIETLTSAATWSRPPRTSGCSCSSPGCSNASR